MGDADKRCAALDVNREAAARRLESRNVDQAHQVKPPCMQAAIMVLTYSTESDSSVDGRSV